MSVPNASKAWVYDDLMANMVSWSCLDSVPSLGSWDHIRLLKSTNRRDDITRSFSLDETGVIPSAAWCHSISIAIGPHLLADSLVED